MAAEFYTLMNFFHVDPYALRILFGFDRSRLSIKQTFVVTLSAEKKLLIHLASPCGLCTIFFKVLIEKYK